MIWRTVAIVALFLSTPLFLHAEVATSSAADPLPPDASMGSGSVPASPASMPAAGLATSTPASALPATPRAVSNPAPVSAPAPTPVSAADEPEPSADSFPFIPVAIAAAIALLGFGAFKLFGAAGQNKGESGSCEDIKNQLEARKSEQTALDAQIIGQESALELARRKLKEKAEAKIEEKMVAVIKQIGEDVKTKVLGRDGMPRKGVDAVESLYGTYKDLEEKFEQAKKLLSALQARREGLSKEVAALESSYTACVGALAGADLLKKPADGGVDVPVLFPARAIIFDWGGVIATEALWNWLRKNVPDIEKKKEYFQSIIDKENIGNESPEGLVGVLAHEVGKVGEAVAIELNLEQAVNPDMVALIRVLKKKYKIALLSNASLHLRKIISENNLDDAFDEVLISAEHKMIKPDPAIYAKILEMLAVKPSEAIFIDDRKKNVDAANQSGIRGILFTSHAELLKELNKLGITVDGNKK